MEENEFIPPPGMTDKTAILLTWLLNFIQKQGFTIFLLVIYAGYSSWKFEKVQDRLDACQTSKYQEETTQLIQSNTAVIVAIETFIGKLNVPPTNKKLRQ